MRRRLKVSAWKRVWALRHIVADRLDVEQLQRHDGYASPDLDAALA